MSRQIIRDKTHVFVIEPRYGVGFDLDHVIRVSYDDPCGDGTFFFEAITDVGAAARFNATPTEARQIFMDTPWIRVVPVTK